MISKNKIFKLLPLGGLLIFLLVFFVSCKKYLDAKQNYSQSSASSLTDLQAMMDDAQYMNYRSPEMPEDAADDYFLPASTYQSMDVTTQKIYSWSLQNYTFPNDWANLYIPVYNANLCLENLQKIERTATNSNEWDNVKGSALFFRAYSYLTLCWTFSKAYDKNSAEQDFGIALRNSSDFNIPSVRSTVEESYRQIIHDLKAALHYLPALAEVPLRPSKAAAYGTLARTYLSMRVYDSAYSYADSALQIQPQLLDYNTVNISSPLPFTRFNKEVIFFTAIGLHEVSGAHPKFGRIDSTLYSYYEDNDLRKIAFFRPVRDGFQFKGMYSNNANSPFTGIATDEMYLTRAECAVRMGKVDEGVKDLNLLLENRFKTGTSVPIVITDSTAALDTILLERRKELVMRTLRWIDIKRLNKEGRDIVPVRIIDGQKFSLPPNDNRYALPIPTDVVNISGMPQNPF
jgi:starch-binding outer membrane protein, SusD/RagB family